MNIHNYLQVVLALEKRLAEYFIKVAEYHKSEPEIYYGCQEMAAISTDHTREIKKVASEGKHFPLSEKRSNSMIKEFETGTELETDLRLLWLLTKESGLVYNLLHHLSKSTGDSKLATISGTYEQDSQRQSAWLHSRMIYIVEMVTERS